MHKAITLHNMSILEAAPDYEYVPIIKTVPFILEKLNNANQQTLISLYDRDFLYESSSQDSDFELKKACSEV